MRKRLVRYFVGHGKHVQVSSEQRCVKAPAPRVDIDSAYAGCVLTRKSTTCAHLFHGVQPDQSRKLDAMHTKFECC